MKSKGYIHIYTGNGKGKTTAALGLALRAAGAGLRSLIIQLMKDFPYSEINSLKLLSDYITVKQIGSDDWVFNKQPAPDEEKDKALAMIDSVIESMQKEEYDIYILDEICVSIHFGLLKEEDALRIIDAKKENTELVFTGRYCSQSLINKADLVTEMKELKHYYQQGVLSRKGIDS